MDCGMGSGLGTLSVDWVMGRNGAVKLSSSSTQHLVSGKEIDAQHTLSHSQGCGCKGDGIPFF